VLVDPALGLLLAALWLAAGIAVGAAGRRGTRARRLPVGAPVIVVTTKPDDRSFHAVVGQDDGRTVVLEATHILEIGRDPVPVGSITLDHERIAFVQTGVAPVDVLARPERPKPIPLPDTARPARLREAPAPRDPALHAAADHLNGSG
jgi:hypothetical protein